VPEIVKRLTLTSLGFWKTNTKMTTKTTRTGSNLIHALDVFVDAITSEVASDSVPD